MLHTHMHTHNRWQRHHLISPKPKTKPIDLFLIFLGLVLVATFVVAWWTVRAPASIAPSTDPISALPGNASAAAPNVSFEQNTRNLVAANSPEAFQTLLRSLSLSEPASQRSIVLTALKDAAPVVVPELIEALDDPDAGVRAGAAQALGMRRAYEAIGALIDVTRNSDANVRLQAVLSLGVLDAWQALPRMEQLVVIDSSSDVRQAAMGAKESFRKEIARAIGLPAPALLEVFASTGAKPQLYAVTATDLYAQRGVAMWERVSRLPGEPLVIAASTDQTLIYLSTVSAGLYRSLDAGETWEYVEFGSETATHLTVTAIVIDPQNARQVFIALASPGAAVGIADPLGISVSNDGGATWWQLEDSLIDLVHTRLVIDPLWQGFLFGTSQDDTQWRYALPTSNVLTTNPTDGG